MRRLQSWLAHTLLEACADRSTICLPFLFESSISPAPPVMVPAASRAYRTAPHLTAPIPYRVVSCPTVSDRRQWLYGVVFYLLAVARAYDKAHELPTPRVILMVSEARHAHHPAPRAPTRATNHWRTPITIIVTVHSFPRACAVLCYAGRDPALLGRLRERLHVAARGERAHPYAAPRNAQHRRRAEQRRRARAHMWCLSLHPRCYPTLSPLSFPSLFLPPRPIPYPPLPAPTHPLPAVLLPAPGGPFPSFLMLVLLTSAIEAFVFFAGLHLFRFLYSTLLKWEGVDAPLTEGAFEYDMTLALSVGAGAGVFVATEA